MILTETQLHPLIPDAAIQLTGRTTHRHDRNGDSGKIKGGGHCIYVHNDWCTNNKIIYTHCSPHLEVMSVLCRPFYLPRELTVVIMTAVYIPPDANVNIALAHLLDTIRNNSRPILREFTLLLGISTKRA